LKGGKIKMAISFIFVASILMYLLLVLSFALKNYPLGMLSSLGIMVIGIYIAIYNVEHIDNLLTETFALISICIGFFVFINGSIEKIKELM